MIFKFIILVISFQTYLLADSTNQIVWDGQASIRNNICIESLKIYTLKHDKKKYQKIEEALTTSEESQKCKLLKVNNWNAYVDATRAYQCPNLKIVTKNFTLKNFAFIKDKKKVSICVNYLISKKYNLTKGKFEKTSTFQERVQFVKDNIEEITNANMTIAYNAVYGKPTIESIDYDADNELFFGTLKSTKGNLFEKIAINIPLEKAENFYGSNKDTTVIYQYKNGKIYLKNILVSSNGGQQYSAVINEINYKPKDIKVALYKQLKYGEKLIKKLQNDIPKYLKQAKSHTVDNKKWLFIVGIENYEYTDNVKYSAKSAKEFKTVMKKRLGIPEKNVRTLIDRGATSSKIDYRLKEMLRKVKKGDTIYFYYSGHGIPKTILHIC